MNEVLPIKDFFANILCICLQHNVHYISLYFIMMYITFIYSLIPDEILQNAMLNRLH